DYKVTGVQTCALPISRELRAGPPLEPRRGGDPQPPLPARRRLRLLSGVVRAPARPRAARRRGSVGACVRRRAGGSRPRRAAPGRSEERRVGKGWGRGG